MTATPRYLLAISSPIGPLTLEADATHLTALHFGNHGGEDSTPLLRKAKEQLDAYFSGDLHTFTLPLAFHGTAFQNRVWSTLCEIPYGTTIAYRDLAQRVNCPKGFQAVGTANGRNPLPIVVPCHRVIAHNGGLGGYSLGLSVKSFLLDLEKRHT
ncbi:MAG: O-6-methylguanine methyltransferase [Firmicutes bacterium]|nr:O-6-methylguanine methyltransferase [Bacillota bacterium]